MTEFENFLSPGRKGHLIGIGGVSMSSLAEVLNGMGLSITGSDMNESSNVLNLRKKGIPVAIGHNAENITDDVEFVVRTAAVHDENPEIKAAHAKGIPVFERTQAWGAISKDYDNALCICGTHGKTTTTSMCTHIMMAADKDPTVMIGGTLPLLKAGHRVGHGNTIIMEACEYYNSFLSLHPTVAVMLNIEADHLDFFKDINDIIHSFHEFAELTPMNGLVVVNGDDPHAMRSVAGINRKVRTFGTSATSDVYPTDVRDENGYYRFNVMVEGKEYAKVALSVPGRHNMLNALACCAAAEFLGVPGDAAERGLNKFTGSSRRFQLVGKMPNGATVVDDYAHHPSEMKATLNTAKEMHFDRILCAFQPHTYTRTKALFPEFVDALRMCDQAVLAPIYAAREKNTIGIYSSDIAREVPGAVSFDSFDEIADYLRKEAGPNDLVLTMGAGNINEVGPMLIKNK